MSFVNKKSWRNVCKHICQRFVHWIMSYSWTVHTTQHKLVTVNLDKHLLYFLDNFLDKLKITLERITTKGRYLWSYPEYIQGSCWSLLILHVAIRAYFLIASGIHYTYVIEIGISTYSMFRYICHQYSRKNIISIDISCFLQWHIDGHGLQDADS